jgi:hypothetical protein
MIDLANESVLTLNEIARLLPPSRRNRPVSFNCVLRWARRGLKSSSTGEVVKLEVIKVGGRLLSSREALQRFGERLSPPSADMPSSPTDPRTRRQRERAIERAERELDRLGVR